MTDKEREARCVEIADQVVPQYRDDAKVYSCTGTYAKQWSAAYNGAMIALGGKVSA